jgi:hypothetical protein
VEQVDTQDLKSCAAKAAYQFDSGQEHQLLQIKNQEKVQGSQTSLKYGRSGQNWPIGLWANLCLSV